MYELVFTDEFKGWLESLTEAEQDDVVASLVVLRQEGHQLGRPHADTVYSKKMTNLKELRIQHGGKPYRAFFVFDPSRRAIMLCGGDKTGDKRFYKKMIPIAEKIYKQYLARKDDKEIKK